MFINTTNMYLELIAQKLKINFSMWFPIIFVVLIYVEILFLLDLGSHDLMFPTQMAIGCT